MKKIILVFILLLFSACPRPQCEVGQTRCKDGVAEICDSAQQWSFRADCDQVSEQSPGNWECLDGTCERIPEAEDVE